MRGLVRLIAVLMWALVTGAVSAASARVATIRTTVSIAEPSDVSVQAAFVEAVEAATRGALTMGLPRVALRQVFLLRDAVLVEIVATDPDADDEDAGVDESHERGAGAGR